MSFLITGVDDVQKTLDSLIPKHARNLMRATIHEIASQIAKDAKQNAPQSPGGGTLKKAIKARRRKSPPDKPVSEVYVTTGKGVKNDAFYWRFVEYGTSGDRASPEQPFIRPSADKARSNFKSVMTREFGKKLEALAKKDAKKRLK